MGKVAKRIPGGRSNLFQIACPHHRKTGDIVGHYPHAYSATSAPRREKFARLISSLQRNECATRFGPGRNVGFHYPHVSLPVPDNQPIVTDTVEPVKGLGAIRSINPGAT